MQLSLRGIFTLLAFFICLQAHATIEIHEFDSEVERERYQHFIDEMRCPKCQNQNLAGSDSPISADLRRELYEMIKAGKADKEIVDYMVNRYGDFILYRPRITPATYVLWGLPIGLLAVGSLVLSMILRQRRRIAQLPMSAQLSDDERDRLNQLLAASDQSNQSLDTTHPSSGVPRS